MGKSPGKWIKTLLFGKKSVRSQATKGRDGSKAANDKGYGESKGPPSLAVSSPLISEPVLVSTVTSGFPAYTKGTSSNLGGDQAVISPVSENAETQGVARPDASNNPNKFEEEQAAIKAQAAFRGYLARRAFRALKGIIRLQALIRGHLVRRQAVATLYTLQGIVKLQAVVRGRRVRSSGVGLEVHTKFSKGQLVDSRPLDAWKEKLSTNAFVCKLLSSSLVAKPLQIHYDQEHENSVFSWLERWTSAHLRKPLHRPKKTTDSKMRTRRSSYAMETESGRSKRSVRRNSAVGVDSGQTNVTSETEKAKRIVRKFTSSPADSAQEHPQTELEKVKHNLRKVSNSVTESSDRPSVETEKPTRNLRKIASSPSDIPEHNVEDTAEDAKKDITLTTESKPDGETVSKSEAAEGQDDALPNDNSVTESHQLQSVDKEGDALVMNGELSAKEEQQPCNESQKLSKRSSLSGKSEYIENGLQNAPVLPSYMAATESAKAKLRGHISPRFESDSVDKNGYTRRHSLPSSANGKLTSHSPRTQRLVQTGGKGGVKSDRSLFSSKDGNARAIQVEWRR